MFFLAHPSTRQRYLTILAAMRTFAQRVRRMVPDVHQYMIYNVTPILFVCPVLRSLIEPVEELRGEISQDEGAT